jgi:Lrp/AsnC family transcriptional regulator, regulator for asnA, asnC and gidA
LTNYLVSVYSLVLDDIDLEILQILQQDSRMPFTEIGKQLGIADSTVHVRVKKMLEDGVIAKFSISIHHEALGKVESLLMLDVTPGCFEKIIPILIEDRCVEEILELHGEFVAMLKLSANNLAELRDEIVKIRLIPNVTRTEMIAILKVWKTP